jgi:signal transduction histidine kinase
MERRAKRRDGLRVRLAAVFAAGGFVLSATLALVTYATVDRYLTDQRERSATRQAYLYTRLVRDDLRRGAEESFALASLDLPSGSSVLLHRDDRWYTTPGGAEPNDIPRSLRRAVDTGAAHQRLDKASGPAFIVGIEVPALRAEIYQVFPLTELVSTLSVLGTVLLGAAGITTFAAALLGLWAGRHVLRPLVDVSRAAATIASGDLGARLDVEGDPDLADLGESFNTMVSALQARVERDARFASDVSHELRSPLATLTSAVSVLQRHREELAPRAREALDLLSIDVQRFGQLLQDLLELAQAEAATDAADLEAVRVRELVEHATRDSGVRVDVDADLSRGTVLTDKRRLDRVLANLIHNAQTHGGGATRIGVGTANGALRFEVDDAGPGVPTTQREHIFVRFYRGSASGRRGDSAGTGLGLALVAEHVRVMGGDVWVEDRPDGSGARFVVEIPRITP